MTVCQNPLRNQLHVHYQKCARLCVSGGVRKRMVPEGFRKVPGRFSGRDCDIKKTGFRKISGRFPDDFPEERKHTRRRRRSVATQIGGRGKNNSGGAGRKHQKRRRNFSGIFPEDFRKIPGRATPASTPRSVWRQSDAVNKERANLRPNSLLLWFDFMQNVALRIANLELGDMF